MSADAIFVIMSHLVLAGLAVRHVCLSANPIAVKVFWTLFAVAIPVMGPAFCLGLSGMPRQQIPSLRVHNGGIWSSISPYDIRFNDDLDYARNGVDKALRERLLDEFDAFPLGRHLLQYLEDRGVDLVVTNSFPNDKNHPTGEGAVGVFRMGREPVMLLDARRPYASIVHTFAHETRHLAQRSVIIGDERDDPAHFIPESLSPRHTLLHTRLVEMDAETFATHFVIQHGQTHGMTLANDIIARRFHPKSDMYAAYLEAIARSGDNHVLPMIQAAKATFDARIRQAYDSSVLSSYEDDVLPRMQRVLDSPPRDGDRLLYTREAKMYLDGLAPEKEFLLHHAKLYSALFAEAGAPDYISAWDENDFCNFIKKNPSGAEEIPYLLDIQHRFEKLCAQYVGGQWPSIVEKRVPEETKVPEKV